MADNEHKQKKTSVLRKELGSKYPTKTSINLFIEEKHTKKYTFEIILFLIFLGCLTVFSKVMVADQITKTDMMESEYRRYENSLQKIQEQNEVYEEVRAEYSHYGNGYLNDEESNEQDRLDVLNVIEEQLLSQDALQSIDISGNIAQLTIRSEKLGNVSDIVKALEGEKIVEYVTISTAQRERPNVEPAEEIQEETSEEENSDADEQTEEAFGSEETTSAEESTVEEQSDAAASEEEEQSAATSALKEKNVVTTMTIYFKTVSSLEEGNETQTTAGGED